MNYNQLYNYTNPYNYGPSDGTIIFIIVACALITIAAIVAFILCYRKYLGKNADLEAGFSKLLRFDHLYINKLVQILYLVCVIMITATALGMIVVSCAGGFVGFLAGLVSGLLFFVIMQFAVRVGYEMYIIFIRMGRDVGAVRQKFVSEEEIVENQGSLTGGKFFSSKEKYKVPAGGGAVWKCSCGAVNTGNFCTVCGLSKPIQTAAAAAQAAPAAAPAQAAPAAAPVAQAAAPAAGPASQIQAAEGEAAKPEL